jgi:UDP-glucose 4-epimerase
MRVKDARQTFLGWWFRLILTGQKLTIFGDGTQRRDFNYVDDVVRAFLLAGARDEAASEVFNLGGDQPVSLRELAELLFRANGGEGSYRLVPFPADRMAIDIGDYYADATKIRLAVGWEPEVALEDGLRRTLEFYRRHGGVYWGDGS